MNLVSLPILYSMPGPGELVVIFLVVFFLFGAKRLPEIARGFGQAIREFKNTLSGIEKDSEEKNK